MIDLGADLLGFAPFFSGDFTVGFFVIVAVLGALWLILSE